MNEEAQRAADASVKSRGSLGGGGQKRRFSPQARLEPANDPDSGIGANRNRRICGHIYSDGAHDLHSGIITAYAVRPVKPEGRAVHQAQQAHDLRKQAGYRTAT